MSSTPTNPVIEEYDRIATRYDRRWSFYIDATVQETLRRLDVRHGEHVLDVGCGTGVLLEALSAKLPAACLSGADPSPEMLEVARRRLAETIVLKYCSAENLSFAEEVFDVVIFSFGLSIAHTSGSTGGDNVNACSSKPDSPPSASTGTRSTGSGVS